MPVEEPFAEWMRKVADKDDQAAAMVFATYAQRLVGLARARLDGRIRTKIDPEDVAQSVLKSFFARQAQGQFAFDNEDGLWALLAEITLRKCGKWNKYFRARKRGVDREVKPAGPAEDESWQAADDGPPPEDVAVLNDMLEHVLSSLGEQSRKICEARLQGYSPPEIARLVNVSERTVFRTLKSFRDRLQRFTDVPAEAAPAVASPANESADDVDTSQSSLTLIALLRSPGSESAWHNFVLRYGPKLRTWCQQWGLQEADADNVAQEVLAKLALALRTLTYDPNKGRFRNWLKTVARNALSDYRERQARAGAGTGDDKVWEMLNNQESRDGLAVELEAEFERELLQEAMRRVEPLEKERDWKIFKEMAIDGRPGADVAAENRVTIVNAYQIRNRVQKRLEAEVRRLDVSGSPERP